MKSLSIIVVGFLAVVIGGCGLVLNDRAYYVQRVWQDCMGYSHYTFVNDHLLYNWITRDPRTFQTKQEQDCYVEADRRVITTYHDTSPAFYPVINTLPH